MNKIFIKIKGHRWSVEFVKKEEIRKEPELKLNNNWGLCVINEKRLLISTELVLDDDKRRVVTHEITHAFAWEYGFEQVSFSEEVMCDFIGLYGTEIIKHADYVLSQINSAKQQ